MTTSAEDFKSILPRLLAIYPNEPNVQLRKEHHRVGHVAHGWYLRVHRGVEAVLVLSTAGHGAEASPIRRSVIEHSVALRWLAKEGAVVEDVLKRGAAHDARNRKESVEKAGWTSADLALFDAVIADGEGLDRSRDHQLHFKERCDRAGDPHDWAAYLVETAYSHPCWQSAVPYVEQDPETGEVLFRGEGLDPKGDESFAVIHVFQALVAINTISRGKQLNKRLLRFEREIKSAIVKQREAQGLPIPDELR